MMKTPQTDGMDEIYARMALRILDGPRDMEWHNIATQLLDSGPDYGFPRDASGNRTPAKDVFQIAGLILGYCAGLFEWTPEE
jgi:hypothetical protein